MSIRILAIKEKKVRSFEELDFLYEELEPSPGALKSLTQV
jgi:hypothetical protein